jgi:hypothetical protein
MQITIQTFSGAVEYFSAARSKAQVFGHSLAGITGSNSFEDVDVCFASVVCCQVEVSASVGLFTHPEECY